MGGAKWGQIGQKVFFLKNGQKQLKKKRKKEKNPNFLLEMSKTLFHQTHPLRKKWKNDMGQPMGVRQWG